MSDTTDGVNTSFFSNRLYDVLKYIALVVLPAFSALYFGLGEIWNLPKVTEVIGTVAVLDTVLGMVLRSSNLRYKSSDARFDGHVDVVENDGDKQYSLNVKGDPEEVLETKDEVLIKVSKDLTPVEAVEVVEAADKKPVESMPAVESMVESLPAVVKPPRKRAPRKRV